MSMPYKDPEKAKEAWRRHYHSSPDARAKVRERNGQKRERNRAHVDELKSQACTDCGGTFPPVAMDFDHIGDDKTAAITKMVHDGLSLARIAAEIEKCELVCANCHRIRTAARLKGVSGDW